MLRFHFFAAKQGTWVHKNDRGPSFLSKAYFDWAKEVGNMDGGESYIEECPP